MRENQSSSASCIHVSFVLTMTASFVPGLSVEPQVKQEVFASFEKNSPAPLVCVCYSLNPACYLENSNWATIKDSIMAPALYIDGE